MAAKSRSRQRSKERPDGKELLKLELQEIHSAESQLTRALPRLAKTVESEKLQQMLELREQQGQRLIEEVESALEELDETPGRKRNIAAEGLINDLREHTQELEEGPALDAVLIAGIQKTEHYCIAAWGTARSMASATGNKNAVRSMEKALKEGKDLDEELTQLAEQEVMPALLSDASGEGESGDEDEGDDTGRGRSGRSRRGGGSDRRVSS